MLRPGGILVYSTCSFLDSQNEDVLQLFLEQEPLAVVCAIESKHALPARAGKMKHTLRFGPWNRTSGLFVAKLLKPAG